MPLQLNIPEPELFGAEPAPGEIGAVVGQNSGPAGNEAAFYTLAHWGCTIFLVLLATVAIATAGQIALILGFPSTSTAGTIASIGESTTDRGRPVTIVVLEREPEGRFLLAVRNNGAVFNYLRNAFPGDQVSVVYRRGQIVEIEPLDPAGPVVRESSTPLFVWPAVVFLACALLVLLLRSPIPPTRRQGRDGLSGQEHQQGTVQ